MAAETNVKSQSITNRSSLPLVPNTAGQGASAELKSYMDKCSVGATEIQSAGSYYRLVRIPTFAKVRAVYISTDKALDSGTPTLAFDIGIAFSDSEFDGTPPSLRGRIPTTANNGATTTFAAYSSPNKIFGGIAAATLTNSAALPPLNCIFRGLTAGYTMDKIMNQPLWQIFGFTNGQGMPYDPGGFFDIYAYATTGANTGVAGNIGCNVEWVG